MRTRRIAVTDPEPMFEAAGDALEALGYRRVGDAFERGGLLLREQVTFEGNALLYRYATSQLFWGVIIVLMVLGATGLTTVLAPWGIAWLAARGFGPHVVLSALVWFSAFLVCYSPFTWLYAALAAPGFRRERATLDTLLAAAHREG